MNRSSKGFGLAGVLATVVFLIVAAIFSASAKSQPVSTNAIPHDVSAPIFAVKKAEKQAEK
ncbi:hypothetical protein [Paraglaciecola sp. T6c]|uniref:hypothetical protein n=1 Tax=Pseudoalteromonas atlantica (strain T6c / ATCC BAA-1087) TaxID=3042615 RepID=UPI0002D5C2B1|nr:hypothetical protein [Paraglaciecola sp. T6c]